MITILKLLKQLKRMNKDNLVWLTANCVILYNQGGFRKLLKKLSCYGDKSRYRYSTMQHTFDSNAFEEIESDFGNYTVRRNYPIKYPCVLSIQDETFEQSTYIFYVRYITTDLKFSDIENDGKVVNE